MVIYKQASTVEELQQILALQQQNLPKNLSQKEQKKEGFVTVEHDFALLQKMNKRCAHTIALNKDILVGYAISMHPDFKDEIEILKPMFSQINQTLHKEERYIVMGQICVAKAFRRQGIFRGLYQHMQHFLKQEYPLIITEVDYKNTRSMNAHLAVGFKEIHRYKAGGKDWSLIVLE